MSELKSPYHFWNILEGKEQVDFYDILNLLESNGTSIPHEIAHALKKQMLMGKRGHKGLVKDLREAMRSIERFLENIETDDEVISSEEYSVVPLLTEEEIKKALKQGYAYTRDLQLVTITDYDEKRIFPITGTTDSREEESVIYKRQFLKSGAWCSTFEPDERDLCYLELPTFTVEGE